MISNNERGIVIDIGANIGYSSILFHETFINHDIIAIEASELNINYLEQNSKIYSRISVLKALVLNEVKTVSLSMPANLKPMKQRKTGLLTIYGDKLNEEIIISTTLDNIIKKDEFNNGRITFVNMDIEGSEYLALLGSEEVIINHKPIFLVELNLNLNYRDILMFFAKHKYESFTKDLTRIDFKPHKLKGKLDILFIPK